VCSPGLNRVLKQEKTRGGLTPQIRSTANAVLKYMLQTRNIEEHQPQASLTILNSPQNISAPANLRVGTTIASLGHYEFGNLVFHTPGQQVRISSFHPRPIEPRPYDPCSPHMLLRRSPRRNNEFKPRFERLGRPRRLKCLLINDISGRNIK
jgi:hypothetical protein